MAGRRGNGEGSITKRKDGRWQGVFTVGCKDDGSPKKKYVYGKTKKEVAAKLAEISGHVRGGTYIEASDMTLGVWLNKWLIDYKQGTIEDNTWENYKGVVDKHIIPEIGHIKLNQLKPFHLQELYRRKQEPGARLDGKGGIEGKLSTRTVRYIHTICRMALEQAKKSGMILHNPSDATEPPRLERKPVNAMDTEQVAMFLKEARECRYYSAFLLDLNIGARRGELLALTWDDINMNTGEININKTLEKTEKYGLRIKNHTKNKKPRSVGADPVVIEELKKWKAKIAAEKLAAGEAYAKYNLVFPNEIGEPACPRAFGRQFERTISRCNKRIEETAKENGLSPDDLERAKMPKVSPHSLRHSFATLALQEGADIKSIQDALGHYTSSFTLDVYGHVTKKMKSDTEQKIGRVLKTCLQG